MFPDTIIVRSKSIIVASRVYKSLSGAQDQRTGFSHSFLLDFLLTSPHRLFINQPGIVSRFPSTSGIHALSFSLSLGVSLPVSPSASFYLSVPGSDIIAVEINPPMQFQLFCLWKHPPRLGNTEQSNWYQRSLWSRRDSAPQPWPNLTGSVTIRTPWCCHLKVIHLDCIVQHDQTL